MHVLDYPSEIGHAFLKKAQQSKDGQLDTYLSDCLAQNKRGGNISLNYQ